MANIQKLLERQKVIGDEIVCIHTKLADRPIRLQKLNDIKKRTLNYKEEFKANHEILLKYGNKSEDYFIKQYFENVCEIIDQINQIIAEEEYKTNPTTGITSTNKEEYVPDLTEY